MSHKSDCPYRKRHYVNQYVNYKASYTAGPVLEQKIREANAGSASLSTLCHIFCFYTLKSVCVRALPVRHYWSQANSRGVVPELLDTVAKHRYV